MSLERVQIEGDKSIRSDEVAVKRVGPIADNRVLRRDAGNLAAVLCRLRETDGPGYDRIVSAIRLIARSSRTSRSLPTG
jgi:predicted ATPase